MNNNNKSKLNIYLYYIFSICLIYFLFVTIFYLVLYSDRNFLIKLFEKFNVYDNLPFKLTDIDIKKIAYELMDFLIGKKTFLETTININGQTVELYSLTAKIHMSDVRNLFLLNINLHYIALSICFFCLIKLYKTNNLIPNIFKAFKNTLIIIIIFAIILILFGFVNFDKFFEIFHKILFNNEYYLFDPSIDYIILLLPQELFAFIGFKIVIYFISSLLFVLFLLYALLKIQHHQQAKLHL